MGNKLTVHIPLKVFLCLQLDQSQTPNSKIKPAASYKHILESLVITLFREDNQFRKLLSWWTLSINNVLYELSDALILHFKLKCGHYVSKLKGILSASETFFFFLPVLLVFLRPTWSERGFKFVTRNGWGKRGTSFWDKKFSFWRLNYRLKIRMTSQWLKCIAFISAFQEITIVTC